MYAFSNTLAVASFQDKVSITLVSYVVWATTPTACLLGLLGAKRVSHHH